MVNGKLSVWFYFVWQHFILFFLTESGNPFYREANICFRSIKLHHVIWNLWDAVVTGDGKIIGAWFPSPVLVTEVLLKYGKIRFLKSCIKIFLCQKLQEIFPSLLSVVCNNHWNVRSNTRMFEMPKYLKTLWLISICEWEKWLFHISRR